MHINKCLANLSDRGRPIVAECNYHGREKIYHHQPRGHVRHSQTFSRHFFFSPGIPPYRKPGGRLWPYLIITAVGKFTMTNPVGMLGTPGKSDSQTFSRNFFFSLPTETHSRPYREKGQIPANFHKKGVILGSFCIYIYRCGWEGFANTPLCCVRWEREERLRQNVSIPSEGRQAFPKIDCDLFSTTALSSLCLPTPSKVTGNRTDAPSVARIVSDSGASRAVSNHALPFIGLV